MKKVKMMAAALAVSGLLLFANAPVYAQNPEGATTTRTDNDGDNDKDYGWIGLLGLAGLAGLLKRDKHVHTDVDRRTTSNPNR
ncbi:MAG TPA: WGxxGxxG family protein [Flavitalea sp.]|nr:WGxxGxxG family protein [Flavitalea sp.]